MAFKKLRQVRSSSGARTSATRSGQREQLGGEVRLEGLRRRARLGDAVHDRHLQHAVAHGAWPCHGLREVSRAGRRVGRRPGGPGPSLTASG